MSLLYIVLAPLFFTVIAKRITRIMAALKAENKGKLKAEILFTSLTLTTILSLIFAIEKLKN